jgi:TNF receptor-associated protein 1
MSTTTPQKFEFQAEIKQLLDIVIHSLYTEKEIFVRELVSNASDALEKLRHTQLTEKDIFGDQALEINVTTDDQAKTLTIQDFGIGMTRAELIENLGTIAHSGSKKFLQALGEGGAKNTNLIGQFGVGFYAAFMVAKSVKVYSHSWKGRRTRSRLVERRLRQLRDRGGCRCRARHEDRHRAEGRLRRIRHRGPHQGHRRALQRLRILPDQPRRQARQHRPGPLAALEERDQGRGIHRVLQVPGPRLRRPAVLRLHFSADAPLSINALLFVPQENTERFGFARFEPAVSLYCRKVLIDAAPKDLLPEWLRFLKGVVDSEDLPLNISRETMQDKALLEKLGKVITKRFLKFLDEEATQRPDGYVKFYANFGIFLKEGAALDHTHKEQLMKLLRFESSLTDKTKQTSLTDYVSRMGSEQKEIYYLVGKDRTMIESGPYLEGFKARNLEVLFCYEPVDEYVMNNAREFDGKKLIAADHADVKLADIPKPEGALSEDDTKKLTAWLKESLGDRVAEVKASDRLVDSPALAINADAFMSAHMRRMMKAMNKEGSDLPQKANLEINPRSAVIKRLFEIHTAAPDKAKLVAEQILDNALISAGMLEDATPMVARLYKLLEKV